MKTDTPNKRIALYPGCSLEASASNFKKSLEKVFNRLNVQCRELQSWSCCGATSAHAVDHRLHLLLNLRNLALAEEQGFHEILVPCAACYNRLASANRELKEDPQLLDQMDREGQLQYKGTITVRNMLDFFANHLGIETIAKHVKTPLSRLSPVCYYGCLNTRVPHMASYDSVEYPTGMDRLLGALGADVKNWSYKTECCGAGHFITTETLSHKLVAKILKDAEACGANCIAVSCPMCHTNLDLKQKAIRAKAIISKTLPVYFVTELIAQAFQIPQKSKFHHEKT